MRLISKFLALNSEEKSLLIKASILVWAIRIGLCILPFRALHSVSARGPAMTKLANPSEERIVWAVKAASVYVPRATCLTQAVTARILLSMYGYGADLRIGVARESGRLKAHAWLEKEGKVLIGGSTCDYRPLPMEGL
jgi:hypothetical protein